jgi:hypothetical protein
MQPEIREGLVLYVRYMYLNCSVSDLLGITTERTTICLLNRWALGVGSYFRDEPSMVFYSYGGTRRPKRESLFWDSDFC